ncbi:unnamed protein product [Sphagnum tenellum]
MELPQQQQPHGGGAPPPPPPRFSIPSSPQQFNAPMMMQWQQQQQQPPPNMPYDAQPDYYAQQQYAYYPHPPNPYQQHQHQQQPPPPLPLPPQQQQEHVSDSNVAPAQEEDWEAKARAWAATKAAQEAHQQAQLQTQEQSSLVADQPYMDYSQQPPHPPPQQLELQQQFSYQPSLQETGPSGYYGHDTPHNFGRTVSHSYHQEAPPQFQQETPSLFREEGPSSTASFGPTAVPPTSVTLPQSLAQVVSSSYSQDISSHHDQDSSSTGRLSHQQFEYQQPPFQEYPLQQAPPFISNMGMEGPGMAGAIPSSQGWPPPGGPSMPFPPPNMAPGHLGGNGQGPPQQHSQNQNVFGQPPHGPGFWSGGPSPLGGFGGNPGLGPAGGMDFSMFMYNGNGNMSGSERVKKASVPSWLKEELLKKKSAAAALGSATMSEETVRANGDDVGVSTRDDELGFPGRSRSDAQKLSDTEDDEDDEEVTRTESMIQEIKRVLTEVLMKVTDDLFDEIAQEVMDEDEQQALEAEATVVGEVHHKSSSPSPVAAAAPSALTTRVLVGPWQTQGGSDDDSESLSSGVPSVNVLGLANYASDEEDGGRSSQQTNENDEYEPNKSGSKTGERETIDLQNAGVERARGAGRSNMLETEQEKQSGQWKDLAQERKSKEESRRSSHDARRVLKQNVNSEEQGGNEFGARDGSAQDGQSKTGVAESRSTELKRESHSTVSNKSDEVLEWDVPTTVEAMRINKSTHCQVPNDLLGEGLRKVDVENQQLTGASKEGQTKRHEGDSRKGEVESANVGGNKSKHEGKKGESAPREHSEVQRKVREVEGDVDLDHKNQKKREKDKVRNKERVRENEKATAKEKSDRKSKDIEKVRQSRGHGIDRDHRKSDSDKYKRRTEEKHKEMRETKRSRRRRSPSSSSQDQSNSRSTSRSHSSSPSPVKTRSPQRGRTSRSHSRSVPHNMQSPRRHSPSPSREKDRHRRSRSTSPSHKRRHS